jgi:Arc/MetJ-type ribon-helix-helix transcriptional regulator
MTPERTRVVQARLTDQHARQVEQDMATLGLRTHSEAVREGLRLLHKEAEQDALAHEYDEFYGPGHEAPPTTMTAIGDQLAAEVVQQRDTDD